MTEVPCVKGGAAGAAGCIERLCRFAQGAKVEQLYSRKQEGSGAFGTRVLWFVRFAPNHGFRPQSGPVQREFLKPPFGGKTVKQHLRREGNASLFPLRGASPKGKHVTGFSGRCTPLRIQFLCHPGGGSLLYAQLPAPIVILSRRRRILVHDVSEMYGSKYRSAVSGIPVSKRVQEPLAPGFYGSCALRRTMGSAHRAGWFRGSF